MLIIVHDIYPKWSLIIIRVLVGVSLLVLVVGWVGGKKKTNLMLYWTLLKIELSNILVLYILKVVLIFRGFLHFLRVFTLRVILILWAVFILEVVSIFFRLSSFFGEKNHFSERLCREKIIGYANEKLMVSLIISGLWLLVPYFHLQNNQR